MISRKKRLPQERICPKRIDIGKRKRTVGVGRRFFSFGDRKAECTKPKKNFHGIKIVF